MSGTPVFAGPRVPTLLDSRRADTIDSFLDSFPTVARERAIAFIKQAAQMYLRRIRLGPPAQSTP